MHLSDFTMAELQKIRCHYSAEDMAKLFEDDSSAGLRYIKQYTKPPVSFIKECSIDYLLIHLIKYGYPGMSSRFGVSEAFLKKYLLDNISKITSFFVDKFILIDAITRPELESSIDVACIARLFGFTKRGDLSVENRMSSNLGRRGELFYKELRGDQIDQDYNEVNPRHKYDFLDKTYGYVNVKTSKVHRYADGRKYWKYSSGGVPDTDNYACIGLNSERGLLFVVMVKKEFVNHKSFHISKTNILDYNPILLFPKFLVGEEVWKWTREELSLV